ncbi:MAG: ABC transporter ATP-binding protein [Clostridia bacterium]
MLEFLSLKKTYRGGSCAVDGLSLKVEYGDIYGFIGHNGAGKTTAIRCAVGILPFEGGDILVDGVSILKDPVYCKSVMAYIPDNPDIYTHLTGIQYINFIANIYEVNKSDIDARIKEYATAFEIENALGNIIETYSHGMRQKITLIAALIHNPKLLLLDEPFVGLDPKAAHVLKGYMRKLCDNGSAIFFSTHVLDVAEKLCNKIAIIKQSKLIISGDIDEVKGNLSLEDVFLELTDA